MALLYWFCRTLACISVPPIAPDNVVYFVVCVCFFVVVFFQPKSANIFHISPQRKKTFVVGTNRKCLKVLLMSMQIFFVEKYYVDTT